MAKREKPPSPIVRKTARGLSPVHPMDAEAIMGDAPGTEWPTSAHLHHELKLVCGYRMTVVDWDTGEVSQAVDSTAFDAMPADEFRAYFDLAMEKLAEHIGFDPLAFEVAA